MKSLLFAAMLLFSAVIIRANDFSVVLPHGVTANWDSGQAFREETTNRERICANGLWRWQPARTSTIPSGEWGYFKVPGPWPGITDYMQKDCQTLYAHDSWKNEPLATVRSAWYEREILLPENWAGRRIVLTASYVNSLATVYLDGKVAGEIRFPSGEVDITPLARPGQKQVLTLLVTALPLKGVLLSYTDSASAREVKGSVARRGLCGDVFLEGIRKSPTIASFAVQSSVRERELIVSAQFENLDPAPAYTLRTTVREEGIEVREFFSPVQARTLFTTNKWLPAKLWDIHTPQNQFDLTLTLLDSGNRPVDATIPARFGFRELWIDGRDFYLNGSRIFLSAVPLDNAEVGAAWSTYAAARESLERLKSFGINFVYTHNYGCEPGSHLSFEDILHAADDVGMLVALSQPHFSHYDWKSPDADQKNGYADHARFYAKVAGHHPSVVFYSTSHNATGYSEDMNPDWIGREAPRDSWASNNAKLALRAETIIRGIDSSRIVYHHASGNLGAMHPMNFYPNFVPVQEMSDWFGPWATNGLKPAFLCEYGAPFTWDWTMYRGWYKGEREFGSARVPWEFCLAEWNAQFIGDRAYNISEAEKANLRWEAQQFRAGKLWHRWDYPNPVGSDRFDERYPIFALYLTENWRAFRGWNVSAISPWEHEHFWKLRQGTHRGRENLAVDWSGLQRPGYSPDYIEQRYERMDLAFRKEDWIATPAAQALIRNNRPLLAFLGGKRAAFTSKDHNFFPGERVEKQLIVLNNSRETVRFSVSWSFGLPQSIGGASEHSVPTGEQVRLPLELDLPNDIHPGLYVLRADVKFSTGEIQEDELVVHVLSRPRAIAKEPPIALFDPKGDTRILLKKLGLVFSEVGPEANLSNYDTLVVGKQALTVEGAAPDISRVREGLKVILFEQDASVLEKHFGFRTVEYGLRHVFPRVPDHPLLADIPTGALSDWRGEATTVPPRLTYEMRPRYGPTVKWCGLPVTRLWRCGNRGSVASVLIEKPPRGDFLPILDGGYSLQYSPLLEYREGRGMLLFCQMDVTGRTEIDPAAEILIRNIFAYTTQWKAQPKRKTHYAGTDAGRQFLADLGVLVENSEMPGPEDLLVLGETPPKNTAGISAWLRTGGRLVSIAVPEINSVLPDPIRSERREHISSFFEAPPISSPLRGLAAADLHNRAPGLFDLILGGATVIGDGALAASPNGRIAFLQIAPWKFHPLAQMNEKRTFRRASFALSRLLGNLGAATTAPLLDRFKSPPAANEQRFLSGLYLDQPEEWDDPYRFFRW